MEKKETKVKEIIDPTVQVCKYDEKKDTQKVIDGLGVDINDMLQTGVVKDSGETLDNNGIDDPGRIIGRVTSVFDALDAARVIKKYGKKSPAKTQAEVTNLTDARD